MKGINLKKVGAIVAGATIIASSVAFAGLMYGNTALVDDNGQPVAKVVLGSKAAASDGVVAAAIAAKIASAAYKRTTLTAAVPNDATGTCGASGTGSCAISNEKVTLEVTVPGATSEGVNEFATLIGDYIDKDLQSRDNTQADDEYSDAESESDLMEANPFSDGIGGTLTGTPGDLDLYRVSSDNFGAYAHRTLTDPSSGDTYTEAQFAWIKGTTEFSTSDNAVEANPSLLVYQIKFEESTSTGIPVCSSDEDSDDNFADCVATATEYTGKHRVKIGFLGSDWVITDLVPTTTTIDNEDEVATGGSVTLAKESVYGIVNVGDSITTKDGQLKIRLDDISTPVTTDMVAPAIVSFLDSNGNVVSQDQITPPNTMKKTIGGKTYKVKVYQTAPGYTFGAKWAEMALIESELELTDGDTVDDDKNTDWNVNVLWKNRKGSVAQDDADALRGILLSKSAFGDAMMAGDSANMIEDPVAYKLTYKGLDIAADEYDTLKYATGGSLSLSMAEGGTCKLAAGDYIKFTSNVDNAFKLTGYDDKDSNVVTGKGKEFFYLMAAPADCDNSVGSGSAVGGDLVMKTSDNKYSVLDTNVDAIAGTLEVQYKTAGSSGDTTDGGAILFDGGLLGVDPVISLYEDIGTTTEAATGDTDDHTAGIMTVAYDTDSFFDETATDDNQVTFSLESSHGAANLGALGYVDEASTADYDEGEFISPRGSKFDSMSSSAVTFKIAEKIAKAQYQFATTEAAGSTPSTTQITLAEGESKTIEGVTIKVKSIDETVGGCAASGGSATCTVPKDNIAAVIMPSNTASVDAIVPYAALDSKLVVLDKDAAAVTTGVLITVGGDKVNTVTADAISGSDVDFAANPVVVKVLGNKIVVAGLSADDTVAAGNQFLADVK